MRRNRLQVPKLAFVGPVCSEYVKDLVHLQQLFLGYQCPRLPEFFDLSSASAHP